MSEVLFFLLWQKLGQKQSTQTGTRRGKTTVRSTTAAQAHRNRGAWQLGATRKQRRLGRATGLAKALDDLPLGDALLLEELDALGESRFQNLNKRKTSTINRHGHIIQVL